MPHNQKYIRHILAFAAFFILLCCFTACSTKKNTAATRAYHAMTTRYNIYFNGHLAFKEGMRATEMANQDDYSTILPLYPVSNHQAAQAATTQMDRTIEKCRKCIKLHSIKTKPKPDPKRRNDPKYKLFMEKEEYNPEMGEAWMLLAKAEFHKGDFLGSIGTFNYIVRHYQTDKDMIAQCQLWTARAYGEMGWLYEAEDMLQKVNQDDLSRKHASLYAAVTADLRLKNGQYKETIPFIKLALPDEKGSSKTRFTYVLAQLYELQGERNAAIETYKKVGTLNPSAEMDFNARLRRTLLSGDLRTLQKMAGQYKNKDRLDYIFGAIGDIYLQKKDTTRALENYTLAAEQSTQNGIQKAVVLIAAGDLWYKQRNYLKAGPCYTEAASILSAENDDYPRIRLRAETLDELAMEANTVILQDSLQRLSRMTEDEQTEIVRRIIAELEQKEKEEAEKAIIAAREAANGNGLQSVNTQNMIGGGGGTAEWYFYNPQLIRQGRQEFTRRWGNRTLEDNWRRSIKSTPTFGNDLYQDPLYNDSITGDSLHSTTPTIVTDNKDPQYYLQQIPRTDADIARSDSLIAQALCNMILIYHNKLEDQNLTEATVQELNRRFPADNRLAEIWFMLYLNALKQNDLAEAKNLKTQIITRFPDSQQAHIVSDPQYFTRMQRMQYEQDSLYEATYNAFRANDFATVRRNKLYAEETFPLSKLMPRFLFLNSIAVARTENQEMFVKELRELVSRYPESETGAMAKDMLAMMNQGMESQQGGDNSSLLDKRGQIEENLPADTLANRTFTAERNTPSAVMLFTKTNEQTLNRLLYEIALYNFSQFLIKDFELKTINSFCTNLDALQITGFESYDEAQWYSSLLQENERLRLLFQETNTEIILIATENIPLLQSRYTIDEYKEFQRQHSLQ